MRSAIIVIAAVLLATSVASANFVTYVDLAGMTTDANQANVVRFTKAGGGAIGGTTMTKTLKDYATGVNTPVNLAVTATDAYFDESFSVTDYPAGTDAAAEFGTIVDNNGYIRHDTQGANSKIDCVFTGLDYTKLYTIVLTGARGEPTYTTRTAIFTISDVDSFTNTSSTGTTFSGPTDPTDVFSTGYNTSASTGYVARFTSIQPGADGDMTVTVAFGPGSSGSRWYVNQLKLVEVPEPAMMSLLALGLPLIMRRRRQ